VLEDRALRKLETYKSIILPNISGKVLKGENPLMFDFGALPEEVLVFDERAHYYIRVALFKLLKE